MAKYFVTVFTCQKNYKLNRQDIKAAYSSKIRKLPKVPSFEPFEKNSQADDTTNC